MFLTIPCCAACKKPPGSNCCPSDDGCENKNGSTPLMLPVNALQDPEWVNAPLRSGPRSPVARGMFACTSIVRVVPASFTVLIRMRSGGDGLAAHVQASSGPPSVPLLD